MSQRWSWIGGKALRLAVNAARVEQLQQFVVHLQRSPRKEHAESQRLILYASSINRRLYAVS